MAFDMLRQEVGQSEVEMSTVFTHARQ